MAGILGAGGYVGGRVMQLGRVHDLVTPVALVRSWKSLGKLSAGPVASRLVDTGNVDGLAAGLQGLASVVNLTLGDVSRIVDETRVMVEACRKAGVRRFIHMSSAVVYGRVERADLPEDAPGDGRSWMLYAREKAKAEDYLRGEMARGGLQIIVLRPGLIWGPGSGWARMMAGQLADGMTLLRNGEGIVNLVHVDNLVSLIFRAVETASGVSGFYNARDRETLTWREFATAMARALGLPASSVAGVPGEPLPWSGKRAFEWCLQQRPLYHLMRRILTKLSPEAKQALKHRVHALTGSGPRPPTAIGQASTAAPRLNREHWTLQTTRHALPAVAFERDFGPVALMPFTAALARTVAWLRFAGSGPDDRPDEAWNSGGSLTIA